MAKVNILMATYDGHDYLKYYVLDSIINQSFNDWNCLIIGDGCDQRTEMIINSFNEKRFKFINLPYNNGGARNLAGAHAKNYGLDLIEKESSYIAHLDHDDLWFSNHLEILVNAMDANSNVDVAYTTGVGLADRAELLGSNPTIFSKPFLNRDAMTTNIAHKNAIFYSSAMIRTNLRNFKFNENPKIKKAGDLLRWSDIKNHGHKFLMIKKVTTIYVTQYFKKTSKPRDIARFVVRHRDKLNG